MHNKEMTDIKEVNLEDMEMKYEKMRAKQSAQERRLRISLEESGQQSPVIVVRSAQAGKYVVIDGHKRVRALRKLKADVVKVTVWAMKEEEALAANYQMSRHSGMTAVEEGWLVAQLHWEWEWSLTRIGERLIKSVSWVSRRLALAERMPEEVRKAVIEGRIGAHAAMNYLMRLPRGKPEEVKVLTEKICDAGLTNREIKEICLSYGKAGAQSQSRIAADPLLFLKAQAAARTGVKDSELSAGEDRCAKNMELIGRISLGLVNYLGRDLNGDIPERTVCKFKILWQECLKRFGLLEETVEALLKAADHHQEK